VDKRRDDRQAQSTNRKGGIVVASVAEPFGRFDIGRVLTRTFSSVGANIGVYAVLSLILVGGPTLAFGLLTTDGMRANPLEMFSTPMFWAALFAQALGSFILQAGIIRATIAELDGTRATIGDCLSTAITSFPAVFVIAILTSLGVMFGFMLLIVPGIILWVMWSIAVPAQIAERCGPIASLSRSRALTKGSRLVVLGLFVVVLMIAWMVQGVAGVAATMFGTVPGAFVTALSGAAVSTLFSVAVAATYVELRTVKEGASTKGLADIFA